MSLPRPVAPELLSETVSGADHLDLRTHARTHVSLVMAFDGLLEWQRVLHVKAQILATKSSW